MNSGNNRTAITSRFKHESWHRSNFFAFPAKLLLMKRWWNESLRSVLVNYCKLFLMSWEWRFWLDSDWLLSTAESEWRLIADPVLRVPFSPPTRQSGESLSDAAAAILRLAILQSELHSLIPHVVAWEHRPSLSASSVQIQSRFLSLRLMKTLHSISSTLSSSSASPPLRIAYGDFIINMCSSLSLMSTLFSELLRFECHVLELWLYSSFFLCKHVFAEDQNSIR